LLHLGERKREQEGMDRLLGFCRSKFYVYYDKQE